MIQLKVLIGSVPVPVREETQPAGLTGGVQIDEPLVAAASKPQGDIFQFLYKPPVHQNIQKGQHFVCRFTAGIRSVRGQFLISEAGEPPDVFPGIPLSDAPEKGDQRPLVFRLKGFAAQQSQPVDIAGSQQGEKLFLGLFRKRLAVCKVPGLGLKAVFAVVGATGDKQRYPDPLAVGNVTVFDFPIVHRRSNPFRREADWVLLYPEWRCDAR